MVLSVVVCLYCIPVCVYIYIFLYVVVVNGLCLFTEKKNPQGDNILTIDLSNMSPLSLPQPAPGGMVASS